MPVSLSYDVTLCLFRIVQEGLNNVVKHSGAHEARVTLTRSVDELTLRFWTPAGGSTRSPRPIGEGWGSRACASACGRLAAS